MFKITKRGKKKSMSLRDIVIGTVFEYENGTTAFKLNRNKVVLLKYSCGVDWLTLADEDGAYLEEPIVEILGEIVEIIVE